MHISSVQVFPFSYRKGAFFCFESFPCCSVSAAFDLSNETKAGLKHIFIYVGQQKTISVPLLTIMTNPHHPASC